MKSRAPEPQAQPKAVSASPEEALLERLVALALAWRDAQQASQPSHADASSLRKAG